MSTWITRRSMLPASAVETCPRSNFMCLTNTKRPWKFRCQPYPPTRFAAMTDESTKAARLDAIRRAEAHAPFLRDSLAALPAIGETFAGCGAEAALRAALKLDHE